MSAMAATTLARREWGDVRDALAALPRPILIVGGYGYANAGDEAMLAGLLTILGRRGVSVLSRRPTETAALHAVRAVGPQAALRTALGARSILIGGGALFGRDMGALARVLPAAGLGAAALGKTVALVGINIDPDTPRVLRPLLGALGRSCAFVAVRDRASVGHFAELGASAHYAPDLSGFVTPAQPSVGRRTLVAAGVTPGRAVVGLALTALDASLGAKVEDALPGWLAAWPGAEVVFIPTSRHPFVAGHDDLVLGRRLAAANPRLRIIEGPLAPANALALFGSLSAVVAMRYHALQFAHRMDTPLVALPYAPKCVEWCADEHIEPARVDDVGPRVTRLLAERADR